MPRKVTTAPKTVKSTTTKTTKTKKSTVKSEDNKVDPRVSLLSQIKVDIKHKNEIQRQYNHI